MSSNGRVLAYIREGSDFGRELQVKACKSIAQLHGLEIDKGGFVVEQYLSERLSLLSLVPRIEAGDVLIVSDLGVLGERPSDLLSVAAKITAKGGRLLVANLGGEVQLPVLRAYCDAFRELEKENVKLRAAMIKQQQQFMEELKQQQVAYEAEVLRQLSERGVPLTSIMSGNGSDKSPSEGRAVRQLREAMNLSQERAGELVPEPDGPISKVMVSRLEQDGGGPKFSAYKLALLKEQHRRQRAVETAEAEIEAD